ncbi:hypothetical protein M0R88_07835 [Halorussus gelatinilyticus]|uniref:DUF7964 domain-containing protein n=1 Tax=Halorussus gelatinilyticus TaxID=2937524 RepID=A0A8U0IMZ1_9EURY|nr:hypothetical protein [Halorussus gelatinilyticus]UPW01995.1 hypothetical protein M0R88_07835 [Halorussus gelatinilyticus]
MSEQHVLDSLPDRAMKRSELDRLAEGESVEWVEPLRTGVKERRDMVDAWILETNGTAHVLLYEIDGWMPQGSFDSEGMDDDEKRERGDEILGF